MDRAAARMRTEVPGVKRITGAPIAGFFLDHVNYLNTSGHNYPTEMNYVYHMQNLTAGALNADCLRQHPDTPYWLLHAPAHAELRPDHLLHVQLEMRRVASEQHPTATRRLSILAIPPSGLRS